MGGRRGKVASHPERGEDVRAEDMTENPLGNVGWFWEVKMADPVMKALVGQA